MMIKGWRSNPDWVSFYFGKKANEEQLRLFRSMQRTNEETAARQKDIIEEQRKHFAECHAAKAAAGEVEPLPLVIRQ